MNYSNFLLDIEGIISQTLAICKEFSNWSEDHITMSLLENIASQYKRTTIKGWEKQVATVDIGAFKALGNLETEGGDIAILLRIKYKDQYGKGLDEVLEGVGLLEAKKVSGKNRDFSSSIKGNKGEPCAQFEKILEKRSSPLLILYDYENILEDENYKKYRAYNVSRPTTLNAVVLPMELMQESKWRDRKLYRFSVPFSHQLINRYLRGLDLESDTEFVKAVKGQGRSRGLAKYLLSISLCYSSGEPDPGDNFMSSTINLSLYEEIKGGRTT